MKPTIRHFGNISENGTISFNDETLWQNQRMSLRGKRFELVIKERVQKPSPNQFSYLFGGILPTIMSCNEFSHYTDPKELFDDYFAPKFLSYQVLVRKGKKTWLQTKTKGLSDLNKKEMAELVDKMLTYCGQEGIEVLEAEAYVTKNYREIDVK